MYEGQGTQSRSVLISGASIAGPALAYWLERYGFEVTVIERAPTLRHGGYPIDIRGTALGVVERMGLLPRVQAAHIASRELRFVDAAGRVICRLPPDEIISNESGRDVELPRGTLTRLLYDATQTTKNQSIRYRFNDSIETLEDDGSGVEIGFKSGERQRYDVVIGADGIHSNTRRLVFGPEKAFNHYLGNCFNLFSMSNEMGLSHGGIVYGEAGRTAGGWEVPRLLKAMRQAQDLYFDTVSQIRMPVWSSGRVALVGDAAYAPSFRSGQGTSLALVGAYVLAGELASHDDPVHAFAAYERRLRPFVEANQALAIEGNGFMLLPRTPQELEARNQILAALAAGESMGERNDHARKVHRMLKLPDYTAALGL